MHENDDIINAALKKKTEMQLNAKIKITLC